MENEETEELIKSIEESLKQLESMEYMDTFMEKTLRTNEKCE